MKGKLTNFFVVGLLGLSTISFGAAAIIGSETTEASAYYTPSTTYTNGDAATYYNGISSTASGDTLLADLRTLNLYKRGTKVGYKKMGTDVSTSAYVYTDYDPSTVQYDANGQPYGTKLISFYTGGSIVGSTEWNKEHVWPASRLTGGRDNNVVDDDIFMPRPTLKSENSSRGNSIFYEGRANGSTGWDPITDFGEGGVYPNVRGESARIIFYCMTCDSTLVLNENTGNDGNNMGRLTDLLRWNLQYPVNQREKNRNEGGEYLQGNRNAFVDHPEYACKIWGNTSDATRQICNGTTPSGNITLNKSSATVKVGETVALTATASSGSPTFSWSSSNTSVATVSSSGVVTGVAKGTATITVTGVVEGETKSATATITVKEQSSSTGEWVKVTNTSDISEGDEVTFAYETGGKVCGALSGTVFTDVSASFDDGVMTTENEFTSFTLGKSGNNWTFSTDDGLLGATAAKKLAYGSGTTTWTISISNGNANIANTTSTYGTMKYNTDAPRFTTYTSGQAAIQLYKLDGSSPVPTKTLSGISVSGAKTAFNTGDAFSFGGTVTATYDNGTTANVTSSVSFSGYNLSNAGTQTVTVSYTENGVTKTATYTITVTAAAVVLNSIAVSGQKTSFTVGDTFTFGGTVTGTYSNGTTANLTSSATFSGYDMSTAGTQTVTVSAGGKTTTYAIVVSNGSSSEYSGLITEGSYYIKHADKYLKSNGTSSLPSAVASSDDATIFNFTLVADDTYEIKTTDGSYLYTTGANNGLRVGSTSDSWVVSTGTLASGAYDFKDTNNDRFLTLYNNSDFRTYTSATQANRKENTDVEPAGSTPTPATLVSIAVSGQTTSFSVGDTFTFGGTVTGTYNNGTTANLTSSASFSGYNMSTEGTQTVTVTVQGISTTYSITISASTAPHGTTINDPLTVAEARSVIDGGNYGTTIYYVKGIVKKIASAWSDQYHNISFFMINETATDKNDTLDFEAYRVGVQNDIVGTAIAVGDTVIVSGQLTLYTKSSTYETVQNTGYVVDQKTVAQKAAGYAEEFNNANVCGTNNNTTAILSVWNSMATAYNALDIFTREYLTAVDVTSESNATIVNCITRYDRVQEVRGSATYANFMNRTSTTASRKTNTSNDAQIIILVMTAVSLLGFTAIIAFRKKKFVK